MQPKHYAILLLAAILEVIGDALIRTGLPRWSGGARIVGTVVIAAGIAVLATYGVFVNKLPLDFSSTLGLYVAFFAVVSCVIGGIRDREVKLTTIAGIVVILVGGLIINYGQKAAR
jgi:hypothetical protein